MAFIRLTRSGYGWSYPVMVNTEAIECCFPDQDKEGNTEIIFREGSISVSDDFETVSKLIEYVTGERSVK